jgi:glutamyl-tRNA synthetase
MQNLTRIAPTPSGFIHIGNAVNFILTYALARHMNAAVELRIDDIDLNRSKDKYIEDIFETMKWLGLDWDFGARNKNEFLKNYSFAHKQNTFLDTILSLRRKKPDIFYACKCSRKKFTGIYHGDCMKFGLELKKGETALKLHIDKETKVTLGNKSIDIYDKFGDITLYQKEGFCSYQFASLFTDEERKTNLIIRGDDLFASSALQLYMAQIMGFENFSKTTFVHHALIFDKNGLKLSKSNGSNALASWRKEGKNPNKLFQIAAKIIGIKEFWEINTKEELLTCKDNLEIFFKLNGQKLSII